MIFTVLLDLPVELRLALAAGDTDGTTSLHDSARRAGHERDEAPDQPCRSRAAGGSKDQLVVALRQEDRNALRLQQRRCLVDNFLEYDG